MSEEKYELLRTFRSLFEGKAYHHRKSNLGDVVASYLYEDLVVLNKSAKLVDRVQHHELVVNLRRARARGSRNNRKRVTCRARAGRDDRDRRRNEDFGESHDQTDRSRYRRFGEAGDTFQKRRRKSNLRGDCRHQLCRSICLIRREKALAHRRQALQASNPRSYPG